MNRAVAIAPESTGPVGRPRAPDLENEEAFRLTVYVRAEHLRRLNNELTERRIAGDRADISLIIRAALDAYFTAKK